MRRGFGQVPAQLVRPRRIPGFGGPRRLIPCV